MTAWLGAPVTGVCWCCESVAVGPSTSGGHGGWQGHPLPSFFIPHALVHASIDLPGCLGVLTVAPARESARTLRLVRLTPFCAPPSAHLIPSRLIVEISSRHCSPLTDMVCELPKFTSWLIPQ